MSLLRIAVAAILATVVAGCGPSYQCFDLEQERCDAGTKAAIDALQPGYRTLTVGQGVGFHSNPAPVLACYPDGSSIVLQVAFDGSNAEVLPELDVGLESLAELCD